MKEILPIESRIIRATPDIIPAIIEVINNGYMVAYREGGPTSKPYFPETYSEDVKQGKIRLFVSYVGDKISGSVQYEDRDGKAFLSQMTVGPDFREKGIGAKLIAAAESSAKEEGFKIMQLTAMVEKGLPEYYKKFGYEKVGIKERTNYTLVEMEKQLG